MGHANLKYRGPVLKRKEATSIENLVRDGQGRGVLLLLLSRRGAIGVDRNDLVRRAVHVLDDGLLNTPSLRRDFACADVQLNGKGVPRRIPQFGSAVGITDCRERYQEYAPE
jgi:hypothetical protein